MAHEVVIDKTLKPNDIEVTTVVSYQGYDQEPLLLVVQEFREKGNSEVFHAEVLYQYPPQFDCTPILSFNKENYEQR